MFRLSLLPHRRRLVVLGSTGSIGRSTLDVVAAHPERLEVVGLVAHTQWQRLAEQCRSFKPTTAILTDREAFDAADRSCFPSETRLLFGDEDVVALVQSPDAEIVLAAVVGAAGLTGTWAAVQAGKAIALANKETLVVAGELVLEEARRTGAVILPVDSEHSAIHQALGGRSIDEVARVVLTASGGPFRGRSASELATVTPAQALKHPTWEMGPKISIDSATLMNKALEVIEAARLFALPAEKLDVIVHPESIVHSFVEFVDGSVLAQLSPPDMKLPIQYALLYPDRLPGPATRLDWATLKSLTFEPPNRGTFPALDLGFEVVRRGGSTGAVLNAANEIAVARFLDGKMGFLDIARCCRAVLDRHEVETNPTLERLMALDTWARTEGSRWTPR